MCYEFKSSSLANSILFIDIFTILISSNMLKNITETRHLEGWVMVIMWWVVLSLRWLYYIDVIMTTVASQITSLAVAYIYIWLLNRLFRHRSKKTSKLRVTGLCAGISPGSVNSPHKGPVTRKMFPFNDVIMVSWCRAKPFIMASWYKYELCGDKIA